MNDDTIMIDKDVKIPDVINIQYPFLSMEIGDSFFVPRKRAKQARNAARRWELAKFCTRTVTEDSVIGLRVWRIS